MELAVPLTQKQVEAACRLHERLDQWRLSDAVLARLRKELPGFDTESCLLKAIVLNTLYSTQVFAIVRMALHLETILSRRSTETAGPELVEEISLLPTEGNKKLRRFVSFAAKFCHFFIDEERFPIYDDAARKVVELHLGAGEYQRNKARPYLAFYNNLARLRAVAGLNYHGRELDRYLWITGMYMKWLKERQKAKQKMNVELRDLFERPTSVAVAELDALLPAVLDRAFKGELS